MLSGLSPPVSLDIIYILLGEWKSCSALLFQIGFCVCLEWRVKNPFVNIFRTMRPKYLSKPWCSFQPWDKNLISRYSVEHRGIRQGKEGRGEPWSPVSDLAVVWDHSGGTSCHEPPLPRPPHILKASLPRGRAFGGCTRFIRFRKKLGACCIFVKDERYFWSDILALFLHGSVAQWEDRVRKKEVCLLLKSWGFLR